MSDLGSISDVNSNIDGVSLTHRSQTRSLGNTSSQHTAEQIRKSLQEFMVTMAYDKSLTKDKCSLCLMYFNRNSIRYKVPNHRLHALHTEWGKQKKMPEKQGRRYESASFLYQSTTVCLFCAQFFTQLPEEVQNDLNTRDGGYNILSNKEEGMKLAVDTSIIRQNIALDQRVYQSSDVDSKKAEYAIAPPYSHCSKTRREADPWWEMDFGKYKHIYSIEFDISVGVRQALEVYVMLLDKPVGFDNPFLDQMKSYTKMHKVFQLESKGKPRTETIQWILSEHSTCYAMRIQLKGIYTLSLSRVIVLQGNDIVITKPEDYELSSQSLASLDMQSVKAHIKANMSPSKRFQLMEEHHSTMHEHVSFDKSHSIDAVKKLTLHIESRYNHLEKWKSMVLEQSRIFSDSELLMLYRIVFKYVSDSYQHNKGRPIAEHELVTSALIAHYPRCDLTELHQRLRSIIRWLQTRTHMKELGALLDSPALNSVANAPSDQLYYLMTAFKRVEYYWHKKENYEQVHGKLDRLHGRSSHVQHAKVSELRGCSWSQFLMVMSLFCKQQCDAIPEKVFHVDHQYAMRRASELPEELYSMQGNGEGRAVSTYSMSTIVSQKALHGQQKRVQTALDRSRSLGNLRGADNGLNTSSILSNSASLLSSSHRNLSNKEQTKSLLEGVRESGLHPFDSSFSEYKFCHFKKKQQRDNIEFPKTLSLEFAKALIPTRTAISYESQDLALGGNLENNSLDNAAQDDNQSKNSGLSGQSGLASFELPSVPLPGARPTTISRSSAIRPSRASFHTPYNGEETSGAMPILSALKTVKSMFSATSKNIIEELTGSQGHHVTLTRNNTAQSGFELPSSLKSPLKSPLKSMPTMKSMTANSVTSVSKKTVGSASQKSAEFEDWMSQSDVSHNDEGRELNNTVDFFRVCALCELRLPRHSVEIKVLRKHIVKLRTTWDPTLVSKEVRSLDNTISMYNLVYVCLFCAQYFDPDFPDGLAYPKRVPAKKMKGNKILDMIDTVEGYSSKHMVPFFDNRHHANNIEAGDVFKRPRTVESRKRAQRAREVADLMAERMRELQERSLSTSTGSDREGLTGVLPPKTPKMVKSSTDNSSNLSYTM